MYQGGTIVSLGQKSFGLNPCYGVHGINNITTFHPKSFCLGFITKKMLDIFVYHPDGNFNQLELVWCRLH